MDETGDKAESGGKPVVDEQASAANALALATTGVAWATALRPGAAPLAPVVLVLGAGSTEFGPYGRMFLANWLAPRSRDAATAVDRIWWHTAKEFHYAPGVFGAKPDPARLDEVERELIKLLARCWPSAPKLGELIKSGNLPRELARFVAGKLGEASALFHPGGAGELGHRVVLQMIAWTMEQALAEQKHFAGVEPYDLFKELDLGLALPPAIFDADHAETLAPAIAKLTPMLNAAGLNYGLKYNEALKIGREALKLGDDGKLDEAEAKFNQAATIFEAIGDRAEVGNVLMNLGSIEDQRQHPDLAAAHYTKALALFDGRGIENKMADALQSLGLLEFLRLNFAASAGYYEQALKHCHEEQRNPITINLHNALIEVESDRGDFLKAAEHGRIALSLHPDDVTASGLLGNFGATLFRAGKLDEAADALKKCFALCEKLDNKSGCAIALQSLGAVEAARQNKAEACSCLKRSHELFVGLGDEAGIRDVAALIKECGCA